MPFRPRQLAHRAAPMRVAIVHEWFETYAGSERVVAQWCRMFPQADVFVLIDRLPADERGFLRGHRVVTTALQRHFLAARFRVLVGSFPRLVESHDLTGYDLVLSSSHCVAHGCLIGPDTLHVSYVYSPMRYAWDQQELYLRRVPWLLRARARRTLEALRRWDVAASARSQHVATISRFIARRIRTCWGREADAIIPPPVDVAGFALAHAPRGDFCVTAGRLVGYKRVDVVVDAFAQLPEQRLIVIGEGPESADLRRRAGRNVTFLGHAPQVVLRDHLARARAFLFAAEEDFGIAPVEAMACGTPVVAYGRGGALDSVVEGSSGTFFDAQTPAACAAALRRLLAAPPSAIAVRQVAERFAEPIFRQRFAAYLSQRWDAFRAGLGRATGPLVVAEAGSAESAP